MAWLHRSLLTLVVWLVFSIVIPAFAVTIEESLEQQGLVNINTADAATLEDKLYGIGHAKAAAIITYRETYGPIASVEELIEVPGIGQKTIEKNRDRIIIQ